MLVSREKMKSKEEIIPILIAMVLAALVGIYFCLLSTVILEGKVVDGTSMTPTLADKQTVCIDTSLTPARGDIAVVHMLNYVGRDEDYIKRVMGTAGDEIKMILEGEIKTRWSGDEVYTVTVNGQTDPYFTEPLRVTRIPWTDKTRSWKEDFERDGVVTVIVPEGEMFLMGDNRNDSADSRAYGCIKVSDTVGVVTDYKHFGKNISTYLSLMRLFAIFLIGSLFLGGDKLLFTGERPVDE